MKKNGNKNVSMLTLFGVFVFGLVLFFNMRSISDSSYDNSDVTLDEVEKNVVAAKSAEMD